MVWWKRQIWYSREIDFCRPPVVARPPACWLIFLFIPPFLSSSAIVVKVVCIVASLFTVPVVAVEACLGKSFWIDCYVILVITKCWNLLFFDRTLVMIFERPREKNSPCFFLSLLLHQSGLTGKKAEDAVSGVVWVQVNQYWNTK